MPPTNVEPPKKRAKKVKIAKDPKNDLPPTKHIWVAITNTKQGKGGAKQSRGENSSQTILSGSTKPTSCLSNTMIEDVKIEKLVSGLVDMVAGEIHYCASVFGPLPPKVVVDINGVPLYKTKTSTIGLTEEASNLSSKG